MRVSECGNECDSLSWVSTEYLGQRMSVDYIEARVDVDSGCAVLLSVFSASGFVGKKGGVPEMTRLFMDLFLFWIGTLQGPPACPWFASVCGLACVCF